MRTSFTTTEESLAALAELGRLVRSGAPASGLFAAQENLLRAEGESRGAAFLPAAQLRLAYDLTPEESLLLAACAACLADGNPLPDAQQQRALLRSLGGAEGALPTLFAGGLHPVAADLLLSRAPRLPQGLRLLWCRPQKLYHSAAVLAALRTFVRALGEHPEALPAAVVLCGEPGSGRHFLYSQLAAEENGALLIADGSGVVDAQFALDTARICGALVCVDDNETARALGAAMRGECPLLLYLAQPHGEEPDTAEAASVLRREVMPLSAAARAQALRDFCPAADDETQALGLLRPTMGRLVEAAHRLRAERLCGTDPAPLTALLRESGAAALRRQAQVFGGSVRLQDLVLPAPALEQIHNLCSFARVRETVFGSWGFGEKMPTGRGLTALFYGAPGTGKTMAAAAVAGELGMELYRVDLSQLISKYIGETQKNIARVFDAARECDCILFFDEADALFSRRSESADAQDRYANAEIAYLLQRTEQVDGIVLMATNLLQNFDDAFRRRIGFMIHFPLPDAALRRQLWEKTLPPRAPQEKLDLPLLAEQLELSGAEIRSAALTAARMAAAAGEPIKMEFLVCAAHAEYRKQGRAFPAKLDLMFPTERGAAL